MINGDRSQGVVKNHSFVVGIKAFNAQNAQNINSCEQNKTKMEREATTAYLWRNSMVRRPHHGLIVVATSSPALQFHFIASSWVLLACGTCHSMCMLGVS